MPRVRPKTVKKLKHAGIARIAGRPAKPSPKLSNGSRRAATEIGEIVRKRADDHRNRIAVEQQPKRSLSLLKFGNVDAEADDAAVLGQPLLDQDAAAVGKDLLVALAGLIELAEPLGDPLFLAADRFRIIAAFDADPDRILQPRARHKQIGTAAVDLRIFFVPENVAAFGVEKHDALRQDVDRLAQSLVGFSRLGNRRLGLCALAHNLADLC